MGLGNIWRFPYEVGSSGGAGFLLIYLVAVLLVGVPLMIAEISLGRTAQTDSIGVYLKLAPRTWWWLVGAIANRHARHDDAHGANGDVVADQDSG